MAATSTEVVHEPDLVHPPTPLGVARAHAVGLSHTHPDTAALQPEEDASHAYAYMQQTHRPRRRLPRFEVLKWTEPRRLRLLPYESAMPPSPPARAAVPRARSHHGGADDRPRKRATRSRFVDKTSYSWISTSTTTTVTLPSATVQLVRRPGELHFGADPYLTATYAIAPPHPQQALLPYSVPHEPSRMVVVEESVGQSGANETSSPSLPRLSSHGVAASSPTPLLLRHESEPVRDAPDAVRGNSAQLPPLPSSQLLAPPALVRAASARPAAVYTAYESHGVARTREKGRPPLPHANGWVEQGEGVVLNEAARPVVERDGTTDGVHDVVLAR